MAGLRKGCPRRPGSPWTWRSERTGHAPRLAAGAPQARGGEAGTARDRERPVRSARTQGERWESCFADEGQRAFHLLSLRRRGAWQAAMPDAESKVSRRCDTGRWVRRVGESERFGKQRAALAECGERKRLLAESSIERELTHGQTQAATSARLPLFPLVTLCLSFCQCLSLLRLQLQRQATSGDWQAARQRFAWRTCDHLRPLCVAAASAISFSGQHPEGCQTRQFISCSRPPASSPIVSFHFPCSSA